MSQGAGFENILNSAEQLLWDTDRFKQRAGAELLAGVTRGIATLALIKVKYGLAIDIIGAKNWPKQHFDQLWSWIISRLDRIYTNIKPDTIGFWEATFTVSLSLFTGLAAVKPLHKALLEGRDPRRVPALSDWILSRSLDFYSDSAFASMYEPHHLPYGNSLASLAIKTLTILGCFLDYVGYRDVPLLDRYFALLLGGTDVSFAEVASYDIAARRFVDLYCFRSGFPYLQIYS
jgi:proteasome activator subunit 4